VTGSDLAWLSAVEIVRAIGSGEIGAQDVLWAQMPRMAEHYNSLHAFIELEKKPRAGAVGPLAGVTVGAKESDQVKGLSWTWSSPKFKGQKAKADSPPIKRLREAGAAIVGKTNIPELVASVGTVSPLFGATQNPWRRGITPGGSSGGSAAAVAAGLVTVATADDLGGSIRMPASCCGVVGLRPSPGRIPDDLPDPSTINSRGVITRSVADARLLFEVLTGETGPAARSGRARFLAVTETPIGIAAGPAAAVARAAKALAKAGHLVDPMEWNPLPVAESYKVVRRVSLGAWPGEPEEYGPIRTLLAEGREIAAIDYWRALRNGLAAGRGIRDRLEEGYDAILTPTIGLLPMPHDQVPAFLGDAWNQHVQFVLPVSYSWLPSISIPAGELDGLPVGVMLTGHLRKESALLDLAAELEAMPGFGFHRPPGWD
jgi:amidase